MLLGRCDPAPRRSRASNPTAPIRPEPIRLRSSACRARRDRGAPRGCRWWPGFRAWPAGRRASERGRGVWLQRAAPRLAGPARGRRVRRGTRTPRRRVRLRVTRRLAVTRRFCTRGRDPVLVARVAVDRPARPEPASATRPRRVADPPPSGPARTAVPRRVVPANGGRAGLVPATGARPAAPAPVRATGVPSGGHAGWRTRRRRTRPGCGPSPGSASAAWGEPAAQRRSRSTATRRGSASAPQPWRDARPGSRLPVRRRLRTGHASDPIDGQRGGVQSYSHCLPGTAIGQRQAATI